MSNDAPNHNDETHYEATQRLYDVITAELKDGEVEGTVLDVVDYVLTNPEHDKETVAAVKLAALLDADDFAGLALSMADDVSQDITKVVDVRYGNKSDRGLYDNRPFVKVYHVRVAGEIHQMGHVMMAAESEEFGFVHYPDSAAVEDMVQIRNGLQEAGRPCDFVNVDVVENALGIDVPDFDDSDDDDDVALIGSFSPSDDAQTEYNLGDVRGVRFSENTAEKLREVGLDSVERIARADVGHVENADGVDREQAEMIYESAERMVYGADDGPTKTGVGRTRSF